LSSAAVLAIGLVCIAAGLALGWWLPPHGRRPGRGGGTRTRRILLPFTGEALSTRALEAAFRLARAEGATLLPAYLATVPRRLPMDAPLPRQSEFALPVVEAIEQRAARAGIPTDCRVSRGRTARDALRRLLEDESVDRIVVGARRDGNPGFDAGDIAWLLAEAPVEVVVLRPGPQDHRAVTARGVRGHF
jgi:nucleotide-binding universal stress UspA family protein